MNKKGSEIVSMKLIIGICVVLVVVVVIYALYQAGILDYFSNFIPGFGPEKVSEQVKQEQLTITDADKKIGQQYNNYPTIYLSYTGSLDDEFWIRWNSDINKPQIVTHVNYNSWVVSGKQSSEWIVDDPNLDSGFSSGKVEDRESREILTIMGSASYIEMVNRTADLGSLYTIGVSGNIKTDDLEKSGADKISSPTTESLNSMLRAKQADYFISYDKARNETAKLQIDSLVNSLETLKDDERKEVSITGLGGWYLVGKQPGKLCLCPTETCESEFSSCKTLSKTFGSDSFLDKDPYTIAFMGPSYKK